MDILVGNFPATATMRDLAMLFARFKNNVNFEIVEHGKDNTSPVRFGLVSFASERLALKAIRKLNGKEVEGVTIVVREFFHRAYNNDRRSISWRSRPWYDEERRKRDRRYAGWATGGNTAVSADVAGRR